MGWWDSWEFPTHLYCSAKTSEPRPTSSKCMPPPLQVNRSGHDLDLWLLTLKIFLAMTTHMTNICGTFHWNPSTKYRAIASRKLDVNYERTTDGRHTRKHNTSAAYFRQKHKNRTKKSLLAVNETDERGENRHECYDGSQDHISIQRLLCWWIRTAAAAAVAIT